MIARNPDNLCQELRAFSQGPMGSKCRAWTLPEPAGLQRRLVARCAATISWSGTLCLSVRVWACRGFACTIYGIPLATLLFVNRIPAKVVQETLGHSDVGMTLDIYSHVLPEMQAEAAESLDNLLGDRGQVTIQAKLE